MEDCLTSGCDENDGNDIQCMRQTYPSMTTKKLTLLFLFVLRILFGFGITCNHFIHSISAIPTFHLRFLNLFFHECAPTPSPPKKKNSLFSTNSFAKSPHNTAPLFLLPFLNKLKILSSRCY